MTSHTEVKEHKSAIVNGQSVFYGTGVVSASSSGGVVTNVFDQSSGAASTVTHASPMASWNDAGPAGNTDSCATWTGFSS